LDSAITIPESLQETANLLRRNGVSPEEASRLLMDVTEDQGTHEPIRSLKIAAGVQDDSVERVLLWHAAQRCLPDVAGQPVADGVKALLGKELRAIPAHNVSYEAGSYMFTWAARIVTFRRFPAGVMDWEISGLPRSWSLKVPPKHLPKLLAVVVLQAGGVKPYFFMHVAPKPRSRALVVEKEVMRAYYRMARSLAFQPAVKAIIASAWFYDRQALKDNPHLEYLHRPFRDHGGFITTMGPAPPESGVAEGNAKRRQQYEAGELQYQIGLAIWPRSAALTWAAAHPELEG
jgi:hypothetical protein